MEPATGTATRLGLRDYAPRLRKVVRSRNPVHPAYGDSRRPEIGEACGPEERWTRGSHKSPPRGNRSWSPMSNVYAPSRKELEMEQRLVNDPYWQSERETIRDLLGRLAGAANDSDYYGLQLALVARMKARQQRISELRALQDAVGARLVVLW